MTGTVLIAGLLLCLIAALLYRQQYMVRGVIEVPVEKVAWPWTLTTYSYWPYWFGSSSGSSDANRSSYEIHGHRQIYAPPWGGAGRGANGGHSGGHGGHSGGHGSK